MRSTTLVLLLALVLCGAPVRAQDLYFPPLVGSTWATTDPATLGWCPDRIDSLYAYLGANHTKGFIVLKDGRIVLEHYFGTFTQDSLWYWASAGKTLTSLTTGIAQEEGFLDINAPTDTYLGTGWSDEPPEKEALITVRNQLTMTTGLDDGVPNNHCLVDTCLQYIADAGTRWAYQNAPYTLLDGVIAAATGQSFNSYFYQHVRNPTGMGGAWFNSGDDHVYGSKVRGMARYGLLALNNFVWDGDTLLHDQDYAYAMTHPSQTLNNSYGYLWWLNGQASFMLPTLQFIFPGPIMPDAPADMVNGLGKNEQLLNVVPSQNLVLVRMGEEAVSDNEVSTLFNNVIWQYMNQLSCDTGVTETSAHGTTNVYPDPALDRLTITLPNAEPWSRVDVVDALGRTVLSTSMQGSIDVSALPAGSYCARIGSRSGVHIARFLKQ